MTEEWRICLEEPNYSVSNLGRIQNNESRHIKSLRNDRYGYLRVTLYPSGKTYTIHRLVAKAFLPNPESYDQVNHINGDKEDNRVTNIEWCDASINAHHRDVKLRSKWKGQLNPSATLTVDIVKKIKYGDFKNKNNREIGDLVGVSAEQVRRIRSGERWSHI